MACMCVKARHSSCPQCVCTARRWTEAVIKRYGFYKIAYYWIYQVDHLAININWLNKFEEEKIALLSARLKVYLNWFVYWWFIGQLNSGGMWTIVRDKYIWISCVSVRKYGILKYILSVWVLIKIHWHIENKQLNIRGEKERRAKWKGREMSLRVKEWKRDNQTNLCVFILW